MARLLEVDDLRTQIKLRSGTVHAVDGLSFEVDTGETVGIVGESGCGKTMAAMSIMRLLPHRGYIAGGEVRLEGRDLVSLSDDEIRKVRGNDIGIVFQDPMTSLNPTMTVGRQIAEVVLIHRDVSKDAAMQRAVECLDMVGVPRPKERISDYPHQLSGGLRQRVMIAMALAYEPKLLIADEPTTALDVTIQDQILRLLDRLKAELGMGIILITHDMGVIAGRADRVVVMYAGEKIESSATFELFNNVRHPYTEALLASIPKLNQDKTQELYSIPGLPPDLRNPPSACRFAPRCAFATDRVPNREAAPQGRRPSEPPLRVLPPAPFLGSRADHHGRPADRRGRKELGPGSPVRARARGPDVGQRAGRGRAGRRRWTARHRPGLPGCLEGVSGHGGRDPAPADRDAARHHRREPRDPPRGDLRARRRVGLREDHARPARRRPRGTDSTAR